MTENNAKTSPLSRSKKKKTFFWNTWASMLCSFQSFFILIIVSHFGSTSDAGVFVFSYAAANLMLTIGKYGIRPFQASDINNHYSFGDYLYARALTVVAMCILSIGYCFIHSNINSDKFWVILLWCGIRAIEAFEDVYHGYLHSRDELDVSSKIWGSRTLLTMIVFCITYMIKKDLVLSCICTLIVAAISALVLNLPFKNRYPAETSRNKVISLLTVNFTLFISNFLLNYLGNSPRYAIDGRLSDSMQAIFGYLIMPVFLINLFGNFMLQPLITTYSRHWDSKDYPAFKKLVTLHLSILVGLVIVFLIGGKLIGLRLLEIVYNVELKPYAAILYILLIAGGFQAIQSYFMTLLTVIRFYKLLIVGYIAASLLMVSFGGLIVTHFGMMGISIYFLVVLLLLDIYFAGLLFYRFSQA